MPLSLGIYSEKTIIKSDTCKKYIYVHILHQMTHAPQCSLQHYLQQPGHGDSDGQESACNVGDPGSISGSGRSPREGPATHCIPLPGESHGQRSLMDYGPWGRRESAATNTFTFRTRKQSKCPSTDERIKKIRHMYTR